VNQRDRSYARRPRASGLEAGVPKHAHQWSRPQLSAIIEAMTTPRLPIQPLTLYTECYGLALRRAARAVSRQYDEAFASVGLSSGQFSMLAALAHSSARIQDIAHMLDMDRTTVTAALKPLQRRKLVVVEVAEDDARVREVSITPEGLALLAQAIPLWKELQDALTTALGPRGAQGLRKQLSLLP
jgi:DNA-binding MarR family transcriptional regulator